MTAYLRPDVSDGVRALAAQGAIEAGNLDAMPVAFELIDSKDKTVRTRAALTIARSNSRADLEKLAAMDWSTEPHVLNVIVKELTSKGIPVPISKKL